MSSTLPDCPHGRCRDFDPRDHVRDQCDRRLPRRLRHSSREQWKPIRAQGQAFPPSRDVTRVHVHHCRVRETCHCTCALVRNVDNARAASTITCEIARSNTTRSGNNARSVHRGCNNARARTSRECIRVHVRTTRPRVDIAHAVLPRRRRDAARACTFARHASAARATRSSRVRRRRDDTRASCAGRARRDEARDRIPGSMVWQPRADSNCRYRLERAAS